MLDQLKNLAMQQLMERMGPNSLGQKETNEAAEEGSNALMDVVKQQIASGNLNQVKDLFSNGGADMQSNGIFQNVQGKLMEILQNKGMNADEARAEAESTAPDFINSIKGKFESSAEEDKGFDLNNIAGLIGGDAGGLIGKISKFF